MNNDIFVLPNISIHHTLSMKNWHIHGCGTDTNT